MAISEGSRAFETRQRRERLSLSRPCVELALGSLTIDGYDVAETRRFGNSLAADAARWSVGRVSHDRGWITKSDAHRQFVAAFGQPRKLNSLADYRRGGGR